MNRRGFLRGLGLVVGGIAIDKAIPFNRVWSFPKEIKIVRPNWKIVDDFSDLDYYSVHWLTSKSAWFVQEDPFALIVHPDNYETAKKILGI